MMDKTGTRRRLCATEKRKQESRLARAKCGPHPPIDRPVATLWICGRCRVGQSGSWRVGESASRAVKESIEHVLTQPSTLSPVSISGPPITTGPLHQDPERAGVPLLRLPRTHRGLLHTLTDCRPRSGGVRRNESGRDATTRPRLCWQVGAGGPAYHPVKIPPFSPFNSYNGT